MRIEKKTIALCLIALVTGIAIVLPIAYDRGVISSVQTKPLFNIDVLYANATDTTVNAIINVTTTSEAAKLREGEVKMEIYNFHFYTDQTSIANLTYTMDMPRLTTTDLANGQNIVTVGSHLPGSIAIADGSGTLIDYSSIVNHTTGIGGHTFQRDEKSHVMGIGASLVTHFNITIFIQSSEMDSEEVTTIPYTIPGPSFTPADVTNAQSLYVEVTRIMSVTYQHTSSNVSATPSTTTVLTNNKVVAHIELAKIDDDFVYGNYEEIVKATGGDVPINYNLSPVLFMHPVPSEAFTVAKSDDE